MKVGLLSVPDDLKRIEAARNAIGDHDQNNFHKYIMFYV